MGKNGTLAGPSEGELVEKGTCFPRFGFLFGEFEVRQGGSRIVKFVVRVCDIGSPMRASQWDQSSRSAGVGAFAIWDL